MNAINQGVIQISGEGAKALLQGQLTCDLEEVTLTQYRLGAYCNPQGRILSVFRLFWDGECYYLLMPNEVIASTLATLKKYAIFYKLSLDNITDKIQVLSYSGTDGENSIQQQFHSLPRPFEQTVTNDRVICANLTVTEPHYLVIGNPAAPYDQPMLDDENRWKYLHIRAGITMIYANTIEQFLPHDLNLPQLNGVSFKKGCYTGQEIIARMHYRGQSKKQVRAMQVASPIEPMIGGTIFKNHHPAGSIVEAVRDKNNIYQLVIVANTADLSNNMEFFLDLDQKYSLQYV